jgi:hypothetical protein
VVQGRVVLVAEDMGLPPELGRQGRLILVAEAALVEMAVAVVAVVVAVSSSFVIQTHSPPHQLLHKTLPIPTQ